MFEKAFSILKRLGVMSTYKITKLTSTQNSVLKLILLKLFRDRCLHFRLRIFLQVQWVLLPAVTVKLSEDLKSFQSDS